MPAPGPTSAFGVSRSGSGGPHGLGGLPPESSQSRAPPPFGLPARALSEPAGPQLHAGLGPGLPAPRPAPARGARSRAGSWRVSGSKAARPGRVPPEGQGLKFPPVLPPASGWSFRSSSPELCEPGSKGGWIWGLLFATLPQSPSLDFRGFEDRLSPLTLTPQHYPHHCLSYPLLLPGEGRPGVPVCVWFPA